MQIVFVIFVSVKIISLLVKNVFVILTIIDKPCNLPMAVCRIANTNCNNYFTTKNRMPLLIEGFLSGFVIRSHPCIYNFIRNVMMTQFLVIITVVFSKLYTLSNSLFMSFLPCLILTLIAIIKIKKQIQEN